MIAVASHNRTPATVLDAPTPRCGLNALQHITARPAGRDRHGQPLARRSYLIDREPEPWGNGRWRVFAENRSARKPGGGFYCTPVVVVGIEAGARRG